MGATEGPQGKEPRAPGPWPVPGVRALIDNLNDAVVAFDQAGTVHYANPSADRLLDQPHGALEGRSVAALLPDRLAKRLHQRFSSFADGRAPWAGGRQITLPLKRRDGSELLTEVVLSAIDHPWAGRVVVAILRPRRERSQPWSQLTGDLLEVLASAPVGGRSAQRLLATLGRRLHWDVTMLWSAADGALTYRDGWARSPEVGKASLAGPGAGTCCDGSGMARWVAYHDQPLWLPDLEDKPDLAGPAAIADGLRSAYTFPVRYRGACVGVISMLSRRRRERDPGLVELMAVVGENLGELLKVFNLAHNREQLLTELQEARRTQEFLLQASRVLSEAGGYRQTVERLARVAVPVLADLCLIDVADESGRIERMAAWHADPAKRALTEELQQRYAPDPSGLHPSTDVMRTGRSRWDANMTDDFLASTTRDARHLSIVKELGFTSYMTVPLAVRGRVTGTVSLISAGSGRRFGERDLSAAEELARQVSSVVERARMFEREQQISHDLQKNLLPERFPEVDGWSFAARYLPAAEGMEVGGDWFDVVSLGQGTLALVVGDVEGHDVEAAKVMGRARHLLWLVVQEERSASAALSRLNRFLLSTGIDRITTVLLAVLDTHSGSLALASAGHLPALVVEPDGPRELSVPPGPPLGVAVASYEEEVAPLGQGCLLMFTDGLVERRGRALAEGLSHLSDVASRVPGVEPETVADHVLAGMLPAGTGGDDVALLAVGRRPPGTQSSRRP